MSVSGFMFQPSSFSFLHKFKKIKPYHTAYSQRVLLFIDIDQLLWVCAKSARQYGLVIPYHQDKAFAFSDQK